MYLYEYIAYKTTYFNKRGNLSGKHKLKNSQICENEFLKEAIF